MVSLLSYLDSKTVRDGGLAPYCGGGETEEGSISLRLEATLYGDSPEGFNRPFQVNL